MSYDQHNDSSALLHMPAETLVMASEPTVIGDDTPNVNVTKEESETNRKET